jgi:hypothetical protein
LGTLPNSSCRATAILALRSFFFSTGVIVFLLYQNLMKMPRYETMIIR